MGQARSASSQNCGASDEMHRKGPRHMCLALQLHPQLFQGSAFPEAAHPCYDPEERGCDQYPLCRGWKLVPPPVLTHIFLLGKEDCAPLPRAPKGRSLWVHGGEQQLGQLLPSGRILGLPK